MIFSFSAKLDVLSAKKKKASKTKSLRSLINLGCGDRI